jgi:hypothetical protein
MKKSILLQKVVKIAHFKDVFNRHLLHLLQDRYYGNQNEMYLRRQKNKIKRAKSGPNMVILACLV